MTGTLRGVSPRNGTHAECFCASCRAGEIHTGQPDPAPDPVGIFQTTPDVIHIATGAENLAVFSFGRKNILRWNAACCGAPLFNTARSPKISFVGIRTNRLADTAPLGPVVGQAHVPTADGKTRHKGFARLLSSALSRVLIQRVTGRWKNNPLFDTSTGEPIRPVHIVTQQERAGLPNARP